MFSNPLRLLYASFVVVEAFIRFAANMNGFLISRKCCIYTNILNTKTVAIVQRYAYFSSYISGQVFSILNFRVFRLIYHSGLFVKIRAKPILSQQTLIFCACASKRSFCYFWGLIGIFRLVIQYFLVNLGFIVVSFNLFSDFGHIVTFSFPIYVTCV